MISVIVPVYNVAPYLRQCVESIVNQTYADLDILLIDDGSPDQCGNICEEYKEQDNRIRVFHTDNRGLSAARNIGLQNVKGQYIGFVDADDWIEPDMYESLLRRLEESSTSIAICGFWIESAQRKSEQKLDKTVYQGTDTLQALLYEKIPNNAWNKLYKRELFEGIRFPEGKNYEDVAVMHRIVDKANRVATIDEQKYHYRIRLESITKTYIAENILDYADAYMVQYKFLNDKKLDQFSDEEKLMIAAKGISKVWRWWYGCKTEKKRQYSGRIKALHQFTRENIPLFGYCSWPGSLRISTVFMHSSNNLSFAVLYALNQVFRKLWPDKANVV